MRHAGRGRADGGRIRKRLALCRPSGRRVWNKQRDVKHRCGSEPQTGYFGVPSYRGRCCSGTRRSSVAPPPPGLLALRPEDLRRANTPAGFSATPERINRSYTLRGDGASWSDPEGRLGQSPCTLTESSVVGQLLVNLFHPLDVESAALGVVDHGFGVVHPHHTVGCLLDRLRSVPRLVDVPVGVILQDGDVAPWGKSVKAASKRARFFQERRAVKDVRSHLM